MVTVEGMSVMSVMSLDAASISARCCARQTYLKPELNRCRNEENDAPNFTEAWTGGDCQAGASVLLRPGMVRRPPGRDRIHPRFRSGGISGRRAASAPARVYLCDPGDGHHPQRAWCGRTLP